MLRATGHARMVNVISARQICARTLIAQAQLARRYFVRVRGWVKVMVEACVSD